MKIVIDKDFDSINTNQFEANNVLQIFPNIFNDSRGYFTEVLKNNLSDEIPLWLKSLSWIKQINRSSSSGYTVRGCHTQKAPYCQGKLVEALNAIIYDIITDARPDSKTFGLTKIYVLDPTTQNKLWVPCGFLHAFAVPECDGNAVFQYFCNNVFDKESEIGINPLTLLPTITETYKQQAKDYDSIHIEIYSCLYDILHSEKLSISEKDKNGLNYVDWMQSIKNEYEKTKKVWYK